MSTVLSKACSGFLILTVMLVGCDLRWSDRVSVSQFADVSEAVRANAVAKGWIPDFLPKSATNIIQWHNVEIDRSRVEFSFDAKADRDWIETLFKPVTDSRVELLSRELLESKGATIRPRRELRFFELSAPHGEKGYLAINYDQGRAQYWTRPK
jgi:hypothetical protein